MHHFLETGDSIYLYGRQYHIRSCDDFTRKHLEAEGIKPAENECPAEDELARGHQEVTGGHREAGVDVGLSRGHLARVMSAGGQRREAAESLVKVARKEKGHLRKYLESDGKVLR